MQIIRLIIMREYLVRVRKKSFIVMSLAGPIGMALLMIVPYWFSSQSGASTPQQVYIEAAEDYTEALNSLSTPYTFIKGQAPNPDAGITVTWSAAETPTLSFRGLKKDPQLITLLRLFALNKVNSKRLEKSGIPIALSEISSTFHFSAAEKTKGLGIKMFLAYISGLVIYFFIFLYGIQVMKGIIEEKNNRIIEVVLTTVKPYQLMLGKIFGLGAVGFTQFLIWLLSSISISAGLSHFYSIERFGNQELMALFEEQSTVDFSFIMEMNTLVTTLQALNLSGLLLGFAAFFVVGYLIFASLFAIVGAASDIDTDTQQFIFPITIPLISSMICIQPIISNPNGTLANVLSYIPFSAPIITPARFPFHDQIPYWSLKWSLSMGCSLLGFLVLVAVAAKIYRIGILSYGQKIDYTTLWKWIKQKE